MGVEGHKPTPVRVADPVTIPRISNDCIHRRGVVIAACGSWSVMSRLLITVSGVMLAGLSVLVAAPPNFQTLDAFVLVSGDGYQGAIIPARTGAYIVGAAGAWTPTSDDVAAFEKALSKYAASGAPGARTTSPVAASDLRSLLANLFEYRRQYIGTTKGGQRALHVTACRVSSCGAWQKDFIGGVDMGCWVWTASFEVAEQRITTFGCQGRGGHLRRE
jgi:hypothetical protein